MSHQHFVGKYEVEFKYRISSKFQFLKVLNTIPHEVMLVDNVEKDWFFDTPDRQLKQQNKSVSIREMQPSGIKLWIVKGPEADRCEATDITKSDHAKSMLNTMGYEVCLTMSKTRSVYFVGEFHITVDHLEGHGDFAEFAIMTNDEGKLEGYRVALKQLASQFGLTDDDVEYRSYRNLVTEM
ncbi:class IV adenylate cyclase [Shewanella sp. 202IG2-18]|uniref:class IV adenylate cyclase n=1 Tax=Parashewanella hymeniacidonis TaxID=2807618 RepID=UPI00195FE2E4|nr:class IV adenylate cyclase [Parashewanella hymeniacidonis]MBM7071390.1 class IV adenylate cyclase [Parashewanella hymeniacidonis]